jgi:hypothetical protein
MFLMGGYEEGGGRGSGRRRGRGLIPPGSADEYFRKTQKWGPLALIYVSYGRVRGREEGGERRTVPQRPENINSGSADEYFRKTQK